MPSPPGADAPPEILKLDLNKTDLHGGDVMAGTVQTSLNTASLEARIANFSISVPKVSPGLFALSYTVPNVPFFFHGTYSLDLIARNTAGVATKRSVPITIR